MSIIHELTKKTALPPMFLCRQYFSRERLEVQDIPDHLRAQLDQEKFRSRLRPGMTIAVTAGSRGISNMPLILRTLVDYLSGMGTVPFIVPAMGSHGGATAEGQLEMLAALGITEESMGCPLRSSMAVKEIGRTAEGHAVYLDEIAATADGIIAVNRIKPHTAYAGPYGSGLMKMLTIGLGKQTGAEACHAWGFEELARLVPAYGQVILDNTPLLFALGIIENPYDETWRLVPLLNEEIAGREPLLQEEARKQMPRIYIEQADVLIVDSMGKNYSGFGMDPNITGRAGSGFPMPGLSPQRLGVLDLTAVSHGNGEGVGMADFITRRLFNKLDLEKVYANCVTALSFRGGYIPVIAESDADLIRLAVQSCVGIDRRQPRIIRISNTLNLEHIRISGALAAEAGQHPQMDIEGEAQPWPFDRQGNLTDLYRA